MAFYTTAANRTANELVNYVRNNNRDCVQAHINILYIQKYVLGYPNTCVWKSISKGVQYLNRCSFDCSQELCKEEVQGEARQALKSFSRLCTLWTHSPAGVKCMIFFACSLPISENINSPLLFVLYFWTLKLRAQKLLFGYFW